MTAAVGIEKLRAWPGTLGVSIDAICRARGLDVENFTRRLFCTERSLVGPFEDVVTFAVNAARPMLDEADRARIKLLLVATESAVDQEKPLSSWVHHFLGLPADCRNLEVKHACYGATGALKLALAFLQAHPDPAAKALVITTDHALLGIDGPQEPVLGAGAVALLLSRDAAIGCALEPSGVHAHEVADIFRPATGVETGDADESLVSYLDGVERVWDDFVRKSGRPVAFDRELAGYIYHVPFGGLAERAHVRLARRELGFDRARASEHFRARVAPSLAFNRRMGGIYGGSTFVALLGLLEHGEPVPAGGRVLVYAYGSGSCAEMYTLALGDRARAMARAAKLGALLDARRTLDVAGYERCERALHASLAARDHEPDAALVPGHYESHYAGKDLLVLRAVRDWRREYAWS